MFQYRKSGMALVPIFGGREPPAEWDAAAYHQVSQPQVAWGERVLARIPLAGDERVLDAGCGTGRLWASLLGRLPQGCVIATDLSDRMLREAQRQLLPEHGARVRFVRADLTALPLDAAVDVVFSAATFHWVRDHPRLFRSLWQALKPGGLLVAQCGGGRNLERLLSRAAALMAEERFAPFFRDWTDPWEFADDVVTAGRLAAAGFVEVETGLEAAPTAFPTAAEFRAFVTTVVLRAHLARLPEKALRDRFVGALSEQAARDDPPLQLDYRRLNLRARRPL